jgi:hypothetical protein
MAGPTRDLHLLQAYVVEVTWPVGSPGRGASCVK